MKKIGFIIYSLVFAVLYFASFTSFSTAIEEGNAANFILMLPILGAITLVHYLTLVFINKKFMDVSFFAFEIIGGVVEKGAAAVVILIAVTLVLSPVAAVVVLIAHIAAAILSLTGKGGVSRPKYTYKPTSSAGSYTAPAPKAVPTKKPSNTAPRTPQKSNYDFSDLSYEIKRAIGNGNSSLGYAGSYCLTASMKNLTVNIYDGREITVNIRGTIRYKIDNNEVAYRVQNGDSLDSVRSALDRDTDRLIDETGKNLIACGKHAATMYEKANGYIPKSIEFNSEIGLEPVD